jgi:hypothetical protein
MENLPDVLITKVKLWGNRVIRPDTYMQILDRHKPKLIPVLPEISIWQQIKLYSKLAGFFIQILPILIKMRISYMTNDLKTTIAGGVKVLFLALTVFGVNTGHITEAIVTTVGYAIVDLIQAWYTNKQS